MALNSEKMPDDVYKILNEKALSRSLTPYIIELVRKDINNNLVLSKLDLILSKLDNIQVIKATSENKKSESDEVLKEGTILTANKIEGAIASDDLEEKDF